MRTIGIDASRANTAQRTGTEWYSWHILREWMSHPHDEEFVLYLRNPLLPDMPRLDRNTTARYLRWPPQMLWTQARLSLHMVTHAPDTLFVPAHTIPLIHPADTVTTCHDVGFDRYPDLYSPKELRYHRFSMRLATRTARQIIVISDFTKRELQHFYGVPDERISVIHLGYEPTTPVSSEIAATVLMRHGISSPYILNIARLEKKKNTDGLLRAYALLRQRTTERVQLVLAGNWGEHTVDIRAMLEAHPFRRDIITTGHMGQEGKQALLQNATVFAFPSRYEGFGLPPLEAMAAGVPVVCADSASLPEVCGDAALYAPVEDADALAEQLLRVINDQSTRRALIAKGAARIVQFSWTACAQKTLDVVRGVAK